MEWKWDSYTWGETTILWHHVTPTQSRLKLIVPRTTVLWGVTIPTYHIIHPDFKTVYSAKWSARIFPRDKQLVSTQHLNHWFGWCMRCWKIMSSHLILFQMTLKTEGFYMKITKKGFLNQVKITLNSLIIVHCYRC